MRPFPPKRILAAVDLSEPSLSALEAAKSLALRWDSSLEVVYVEPVHVEFGPPLLPVAGATWLPGAENRREREELVRSGVAGFPAERLKLRSMAGWPAQELTALARPRAAGLVVMGTHGYAGLDRVLFGSVAEAVVRRARVPVLAVHRSAWPQRVARILAPWIAAPYASAALLYAARLARSLGARLDVLHVALPSERGRQAEAGLRRRLESLLKGEDAPAWDFRVLRGDPRGVIVRQADSGRFDLVALSAHRRPFSSDLVLGSTVERVLRHSSVPVLSVPSTGTKRP